MVNDPKKEEIKIPGQETGGQVEQPLSQKEAQDTTEKPATQDRVDHIAIRETIEAMDLDDSQASQAQTHANSANGLDDEEKINYLLGVAKKRGVIVAVHAAKKMNNPYVLDMLHDRLAQDGMYKEFLT